MAREYDGYLAASWAGELREAAFSLVDSITSGHRYTAGSALALIRELADDLAKMLPEPTDE